MSGGRLAHPPWVRSDRVEQRLYVKGDARSPPAIEPAKLC